MITNDISKSIKTIENDIEEIDKQILAKKVTKTITHAC